MKLDFFGERLAFIFLPRFSWRCCHAASIAPDLAARVLGFVDSTPQFWILHTEQICLPEKKQGKPRGREEPPSPEPFP